MDSGIGKSSLNTISQGQVEEIIVSKPQNRRQLIEEVGGLVKYKKRKEATLRKLEAANSNLQKANIIIAEIVSHLKPLEVQATKAKEYKIKKDDLKSIEVSLLNNQISHFKNKFETAKKMKDGIELEKGELTAKVTISQSRIAELDEISHNLNNEIHELSKEKLSYVEKISKNDADFKILQERRLLFAGGSQENERRLKVENEIKSLEQFELELIKKIEIEQNNFQH